MIVKFSDDLKIQTGYRDTVEVDAPTVGAAIQSVFNQYPNLLVFLLQDKCKEAKKTSIKLNGEYIFEAESAWIEVGPEDVLEFSRDIPEGESAAVRIVGGALLMVAGAMGSTWGWWAGGSLWGPALFNSGLALVLGGVGELIAGKPSLPSLSGNGDESNTYTFAGIRNSTVSGTPISIVYGRHRVGGHILNAYVEAAASSSYLYALIGLCEGEISKIEPSSIEINNRNAASFPDIGMYWRKGTTNQYLTVDHILRNPAEGINEVTGIAAQGYRTEFTINNSAKINALKMSVSTSFTDSPASIAAAQVTVYYGTEAIGREYIYTSAGYVNPSGSLVRGAAKDPIFVYFSKPVAGNIKLKFAYNTKINKIELINTQLNYSDTTEDIYGFQRIENSVAQNIVIPYVATSDVSNISSGLIVSTSAEVDTIKVVVSAPALYMRGSTDLISYSVPFRLFYRAHTANNDTAWTEVIDPTTTYFLEGKTKSEITKVFEVNNMNGGLTTYDIRIFRTTEEHTGSLDYQDTVYLKEINEILHDKLIYPNTALLGIRAKATEQLSGGMPNITTVVQGALVAVPSNYISYLDIETDKTVRYTSGTWDGTLTTNRNVSTTGTISSNSTSLVVASAANLNVNDIISIVGIKGYRKITAKAGNTLTLDFATDTAESSTAGTVTLINKVWSDNPVWCLYDILNNERYGLAKYFKIKESKRGLMLANFYLMAQYCDTYLKPDGTESTWDDPTAKPRFSLNIVLDSSKNAIEWINIICASMRASWYYSEGLFWLDIDRPKPITQIFNMSSISDFTQAGNSYKNVPNVYEVQFINKDKDYEIDSFVVESQSIQEDTTIEERKKNLNFIGVTDFNQAASLAAYALNTGERSNSVVTFKTGTRGLLCGIGDVIGVQHDVPQWGFGGHVIAYNATTKELTLNYPMRFELDDDDSPHQYSIKISHKGGKPVTYGIVEQEIEEECAYKETDKVILSSDSDGGSPFPALTFTPERGDMYTIGVTTFETKPFKVAGIKRDTEEKIEITCTEYDEAIYTAADKVDTLGAIVGDPYSSLPDPSYTSVKNFKAEQVVYEDSAGIIKTGVQMYYSIPSNVSWKAVSVKYDIDGSGVWVQLDDNSTGSILLPEVTVNGTYRFVACSVYKNGTKQLVEEALADTLNAPYAEVVVNMELPNTVFMQGVTGLQVQNKGNDPTFEGKDCVITWNKPVSIDALANGVVEPDSTGANTLSGVSWLKEYRITVLNLDGTTRRTDKTTLEVYVYSGEHNHQDGIPTREFTVRVVSVDRLGRISDPAEITVNNPAPAVLT